MKIGILTGGGDCPGLNAVIRAVVRRADQQGDEVIGFLDAWQGLMENRSMPLPPSATRGLLTRGGTILGTTRGGPYDTPEGVSKVQEVLAAHEIDSLIVVGGNGSLSVAARLHGEFNVAVVGVPKTIDNDIVGTDRSFGFATAVQVATDAIDRLHSTAESHDRILVVEVMGRHTGWIAAYSAMAGGAAAVLIPERPYSLERLSDIIRQRHLAGRYASIVVAAEGAVAEGHEAEQLGMPHDKFGHVALGGVGATVTAQLEQLTGFEARVVVLGYLQRGGTPNAYDRVLATTMGAAAADAAHESRFGNMIALKGSRLGLVPLSECLGKTKYFDPAEFSHVATLQYG